MPFTTIRDTDKRKQRPTRTPEIAAFLLVLDGITDVYDPEMAAKKLELAPDRIGDLCVLSGRDVVVGKTPAGHDLSVLDGGLRSHAIDTRRWCRWFCPNRSMKPIAARRRTILATSISSTSPVTQRTANNNERNYLHGNRNPK